ncbi:Cytochrome b561 and DOMON domain-containing protein [Quillaja saponaria]|uniref:Cytochrome b561 and DOMON domain-containing protein n=1 Tax=Quillaja saponaria TaxID=32244 RepID=A0AAD7LT41_QUISA|nr:Cytochrome b561 and DOMON domain-containing protein [Quillaja saponaria]
MANSRSWILTWTSNFVHLCFFLLVVELEAFVAEDDDSSSGGLVSESTCKNINFQSFLPPPYQNISHIACKPVWHTYELRHYQSDDHTMTIILSAPYTTGWIGIGLSKDGLMVGASAMVGWVNKNGHARIKQYYIQGNKSSEVIVDKGELPLNNVPAAVATNGAEIYLAFQLQAMNHLVQQPVLLAFGSKYPHNNHLHKHDDKTTILFDFAPAGSKVITSDNNLGNLRMNHGIVAIIGWGLVLPVGAIVPRYFKHKDPQWYYLHSVIQFVGFGLGLAAILLGRQLYTRMKAQIPAHRGIGIFVFVLSILQIMASFLRPSKISKIRRYWNWYHHWFGRLALFFGALNIVLGIHAAGAGSDWKIGYGFLASVIIVAVIVLEVLAYMKRSEKSNLPPSFQMDPVG